MKGDLMTGVLQPAQLGVTRDLLASDQVRAHCEHASCTCLGQDLSHLDVLRRSIITDDRQRSVLRRRKRLKIAQPEYVFLKLRKPCL